MFSYKIDYTEKVHKCTFQRYFYSENTLYRCMNSLYMRNATRSFSSRVKILTNLDYIMIYIPSFGGFFGFRLCIVHVMQQSRNDNKGELRLFRSHVFS